MAQSDDAATQDRLPTGRLTAHSTMHMPIAGAHLPLATYLPAIYAQHFGMSLYTLGAIFLGERIWGTLTDPLVGWLCDKTKSRFGRRKVWIAAGALLFALSYFVLFFPFAWMSPLVLTLALIVLFLAWSMIVIPYYAWSGELTGNYNERTRVTTYQTVAGSISLVVILMVPALVDYLRPDSQIIKLNAMGAVVLLPLLPITVLTLCAFPDRSKAPVRMTKAEKVPWRETWRAVTAEKTVFKVMLSDFAIVFAQGARGGLFIFYVGFVLGRPNLAATLFLFQFLFGILAAPIWQAISRRIGKHKALIVTELIQSAINLPLIFLGAGDVIIFMALATMQGLTQGSGNLILRAMLADVADEYRLRTGQDRTAMLFSAFSVSGKAGSAIPLGIALPLIAWFGFDPTAASIPSTGLMALALVFGLAPCFAHLVAAWLIRGFDIDEVKQGDIRRKLEARDASEAAAG